MIIIRPEEVNRVKTILEYSKVHLETSSSTAPNKGERPVVEGLLRYVPTIVTGTKTPEYKEALQVLRKTAVRWKDTELWLRTCRVARLDVNLDMIDLNLLHEDITAFGFSNIQEL